VSQTGASGREDYTWKKKSVLGWGVRVAEIVCFMGEFTQEHKIPDGKDLGGEENRFSRGHPAKKKTSAAPRVSGSRYSTDLVQTAPTRGKTHLPVQLSGGSLIVAKEKGTKKNKGGGSAGKI